MLKSGSKLPHSAIASQLQPRIPYPIVSFFATISASHTNFDPRSHGGCSTVTDAPRPWRSGFWSLIATQFQGAFNDNALKCLVIFLIVVTNLAPEDEENKVLLICSLFACPFILFSMT